MSVNSSDELVDTATREPHLKLIQSMESIRAWWKNDEPFSSNMCALRQPHAHDSICFHEQEGRAARRDMDMGSLYCEVIHQPIVSLRPQNVGGSGNTFNNNGL